MSGNRPERLFFLQDDDGETAWMLPGSPIVLEQQQWQIQSCRHVVVSFGRPVVLIVSTSINLISLNKTLRRNYVVQKRLADDTVTEVLIKAVPTP
jgi:hypothetical protein